jgi:hypothetical protein
MDCDLKLIAPLLSIASNPAAHQVAKQLFALISFRLLQPNLQAALSP